MPSNERTKRTRIVYFISGAIRISDICVSMNKKRERVECADCGIVAIVCACADGIEIDVITIVRFYVKHRIGCACDVHSIHSLEMEILRSIVLRQSRIYLVRSSARTCLLIQLPRRNCKLMLICIPKKLWYLFHWQLLCTSARTRTNASH